MQKATGEVWQSRRLTREDIRPKRVRSGPLPWDHLSSHLGQSEECSEHWKLLRTKGRSTNHRTATKTREGKSRMRSALMNRRKLLQRRGKLGNRYHHQPKPSPIHCRESLQIQPNEKVENKTTELLKPNEERVPTITTARGKGFPDHYEDS